MILYYFNYYNRSTFSSMFGGFTRRIFFAANKHIINRNTTSSIFTSINRSKKIINFSHGSLKSSLGKVTIISAALSTDSKNTKDKKNVQNANSEKKEDLDNFMSYFNQIPDYPKDFNWNDKEVSKQLFFGKQLEGSDKEIADLNKAAFILNIVFGLGPVPQKLTIYEFNLITTAADLMRQEDPSIGFGITLALVQIMQHNSHLQDHFVVKNSDE